MNQVETEFIKNLIVDQINSTEKEIVELIGLTKPISLDAINNKTINEKALRDKKSVLQKLERAKERSEKGGLGKCLKCSGEIPFGRLKIMPYTTRCVKRA